MVMNTGWRCKRKTLKSYSRLLGFLVVVVDEKNCELGKSLIGHGFSQ